MCTDMIPNIHRVGVTLLQFKAVLQLSPCELEAAEEESGTGISIL